MNEQTWYMAADICNEVGISNCTVAMRSISPEHKRKLLFGSKGAAEKQFLNESGVYELLKRTRKPGAEEFEKRFTEWLAGGMVEVEPEQDPYESPEGQDNEIKMEGKMEMEVSNAGAMTVFENAEFGKVRTIMIDGEPWFVGKDVAESLGYSNTRKALADHVDEDDKTDGVTIRDSIGRDQTPVVINESGVYSLVFSSKLESAKRFKRWVTSEVLPAIRKTGGYIAGEETMSDDELLSQALLVAQRKLEERARQLDAANARIEEANAQIEEAKPKVLFADAVKSSKTSIMVGELAKLLRQNGVSIGQNRMFEWLRNNDYLMKSGESYNLPTQKSMERGLFEIKESTYVTPDNCVHVSKTTKVTGAGQEYFVNLFLKDKAVG